MAILAAIRTAAKIFPRAAIRRAARKLLVSAEFLEPATILLGAIAARTVAIARRTRAIGPIALRTRPILAKPLTARRVGLLVGKFLLGETRGRARLAAVATRCISARRKRAFLATVARTEVLPRPAIGPIAAARRTIISAEAG